VIPDPEIIRQLTRVTPNADQTKDCPPSWAFEELADGVPMIGVLRGTRCATDPGVLFPIFWIKGEDFGRMRVTGSHPAHTPMADPHPFEPCPACPGGRECLWCGLERQEHEA